MARKQPFLGAEFSDRFKASYAALSHDRPKGVDKVIRALIKQELTPGMRVKPVQPENYYDEARINDGDRLIHRVDGGKIWIVDIISHDDIGKYGKAVKSAF